MNARMESKERNLTWRIQEDSNCWTLLEHFLEPIWYILYVISNLEKLAIQRFKQCASELKWRSYSHWKPITPSWRPISQAAKSQEDGCEISLWLRNGVLQLVKFRSHLARLWNPLECFQIFVTDIFRFFASDIWCLNPHFLLVIHLS